MNLLDFDAGKKCFEPISDSSIEIKMIIIVCNFDKQTNLRNCVSGFPTESHEVNERMRDSEQIQGLH